MRELLAKSSTYFFCTDRYIVCTDFQKLSNGSMNVLSVHHSRHLIADPIMDISCFCLLFILLTKITVVHKVCTGA